MFPTVLYFCVTFPTHGIFQENNWGGGDSERKAALLEEELLTMFKTKKDIYKDEVC